MSSNLTPEYKSFWNFSTTLLTHSHVNTTKGNSVYLLNVSLALVNKAPSPRSWTTAYGSHRYWCPTPSDTAAPALGAAPPPINQLLPATHCCSLGSNVLLCCGLPSEDANLWTPAFGPQPDGCFLLLLCFVILNNKKARAVKTMLIPTEETNPSFLLPSQCAHSRFPPARWEAAACFITPTPAQLPHFPATGTKGMATPMGKPSPSTQPAGLQRYPVCK